VEPFEVRWQNFRSFRDTGWIKIRPLTVIIGPNGSGKTSLLAPFLILKQTLQSSDRSVALQTRGQFFDAGSFQDAVRNRDATKGISFAFRFHHHAEPSKKPAPVGTYPPGEVALTFSLSGDSKYPVLRKYEARDVFWRPMLLRKFGRGGR
jgi:energy-coupling factor transporter ATP-binding protein EcfA2